MNNKLTIHTSTMLDKGKDISCQATDDLQKVSIKSDTVTLDPYCKFYMIYKSVNQLLGDRHDQFPKQHFQLSKLS